MNKDLVIEKQKELIEQFLKSGVQIHAEGRYTEYQKLKDELFDLQCSLEQSEQKVSDETLKEKVKNEIGKEQPSGFKLLTNYYPKDAEDQIDDIFKIIESDLYYRGIDVRFALSQSEPQVSDEDIVDLIYDLSGLDEFEGVKTVRKWIAKIK